MPLKRPLSTPVKTPRKVKIYRKVGSTPERLGQSTSNIKSVKKVSVGSAARCIENYEYKKAFNFLYQNFVGARRAVQSLLKKQIRKEIRIFTKLDNTILGQACTFETMESFSWTTAHQELEAHAPLLMNAIASAITTTRNESSFLGDFYPFKGRTRHMTYNYAVVSKFFHFRRLIKSQGDKSLIPGMICATAIILHQRAPSKFKLVQNMHAIELWRCGSQRKIFNHYGRLGISSSRHTALRLLTKLRTKSDTILQSWKSNIEDSMRKGHHAPATFGLDRESETDTATEKEESSEAKSNGSKSSESSSISEVTSLPDMNMLSPESSDISVDTEDSIAALSPGYTIVWDNVGKMVKASHQSTQRQNRMMLWALSYASENRIPTTHMDNKYVVRASDQEIDSYLPSPVDFHRIRHRMEVIVQRILIHYFPFFKQHFSGKETKHIQHEYSQKSSKKSNIVNLGVFQENPSTAAGTIKILENLHKYVPTVDGKVHPILCFGDGLSCERHNDAHMARSNGLTPSAKLQGLQPIVQEFHKRMLLMQDVMDIFFSGASATDKGTLFYLKNVFGHRSVKKDVGESFNHAVNFIKFVTYGYTLLAAMHVLHCDDLEADDITDVSNIPEDFLQNTAAKVVGMIWEEVDTDINSKTEVEAFNYCKCKTDLGMDFPMIECSGVNCPGNNWYHLECLEMEEEDVPDDDFYCSDQCRIQKLFRYCICKQDLGEFEPMIKCDGANCKRGEWFHFKCVSIESAPEGRWFCSQICRRARGPKKLKKQEQVDGKFNYVRGLLYLGLLEEARHDAIRENDGMAMISQWRLDMLSFHNRNHHKYLVLGHRLLSGVAGWLPERLRTDAIWNRTVNFSGGIGRNLEADLVNEILNKEFKESLKDAAGNITEETVHRHGEICGSLGKTLDRIFAESVNLDYKDYVRRQSIDMSDDLKKFVQLLWTEKFFGEEQGREFRAFPKFKFSMSPKSPARLSKKLYELSKRLDKIRRCTD